MTDLLLTLQQAGVERLRVGTKEIVGACPRHEQRTGHPDNKPSWSINRTTLIHFCFSCGYRGTLHSLLIDLTGVAPLEIEDELKEQSFLRSMEEVRDRADEVLEGSLPYLTDWVLKHQLAPVPRNMLAFRRLRQAAAEAFEVRWDRQRRSWVLPLRSPSGVLLGAQYRRVGSVLTLPAGLSKSTTLFGLNQCAPYDHAVLVESPLDAVRLFGLGIPALASLGAWVSREQVRLLARHFSAVYLALDNDKAGHDGAEVATTMLRKTGTAAVPWRYQGLVDEEGRPAKDPGDVASDDALLGAWSATQRWGL
jgi:DNA primase